MRFRKRRTCYGGASIAGVVEIGNYSTIGTNATILPNKDRKRSFVGAGAVINKDVNDYEVVIGSPARKLRKQQLKADLSFLENNNHTNFTKF